MSIKHSIKTWGKEIGFTQIGITDTNSLDARFFADWLKHKYHGEMRYLEKNCAQRLHPQKIMPDAQSIICCSINYLPLPHQTPTLIAKYALGYDYHQIVREKLKQLVKKIQVQIGNFNYRIFCDSAPILEKTLAQKAGLGWIGKNTLLINPKLGSYVVLGFIFTDLGLPLDKPIKPRCGNCQRCLQACPNHALIAPYKLDARHCLSYLTTEYKHNFTQKLHGKIFGCDTCQQACPWNRFSKITKEQKFMRLSQWRDSTLEDLKQWDEKTFNEKTQTTALERLNYQQWRRNLSKSNE